MGVRTSWMCFFNIPKPSNPALLGCSSKARNFPSNLRPNPKHQALQDVEVASRVASNHARLGSPLPSSDLR